MIAQLFRQLRWLALPVFILLGVGITLWKFSAPLPFPTPAQQELVVLTTTGPLAFDDDDPDNFAGFEHDLTEAFAKELDVEVRYVVASPQEAASQFSAGKAHLAAAWLTPKAGQATSEAFYRSRDVLVQHEASLPLTRLSDLSGRSIHVLAGSRQAAALSEIQSAVPAMEIVEVDEISANDLLEDVAERRIDYAVVDEAMFTVALQVAPSLQASLEISPAQPIAWIFPDNANPELVARARDFIARFQKTPEYARLRDRYFGHVQRLAPGEITAFIEASKTHLPKLRPLFQSAQTLSGIDWRLLAALAYQESQWDASATSPTGVRGIMMLTEDTADHLGVNNRLDAKESILAGARYLDQLRQIAPAGTPEPDRTWLAMAAYNIGRGHFNAAIFIARQLKSRPESWHEMRRVLPLLAKPQYYKRLKSGRARGGEAVILVENVRSYYNILLRFEAPFKPLGNGKKHKAGKTKKRKSHRR